MRFHIVPFEERILLDAAGAANVANSYDIEHSAYKSYTEAHTQDAANTDHPGAVHDNSSQVDGRVLVVSSQIVDHTILSDAAKDGVTVITYDFNTSLADLSAHIAEELTGKQVNSIGFAMLGANGQFSITSDTYVTAQSLIDRADIQTFWKSMGGLVQNGGSIDILACNVAISVEGISLVQNLDNIVDNPATGHYVTVNASIDKTGSADLGGNWTLEVGNVDALNRYFDSTKLDNWHGLLDSPLQVLDINSGSASSTPSNFTQLGNLTFFTATTATAGNELWVTNGTSGGTFMVKDIFSGTTGSSISSIKVSSADNSNVYFIATSSASETSLWKSDGTSAGTVQIANINTAGNDQASGLITDYTGTLYFAASNATQGVELWKYVPGDVAPVLVQDINPGSGSSNPTQLIASRQSNLNSSIMFVANDGTNGSELWRNNTISGGAVLVKNISAGSGSSGITNLSSMTGYGNLVLFSATSSSSTGAELWTSDGTSAGTVMVSDINSGSASSTPGNFVYTNGRVYFAATTAAAGREIWMWDLVASPVMVTNINPGTASSNPVLPTITVTSTDSSGTWGSTPYLFFTATSAANGTELYYINTNTSSGANLIDIVSGSGSSSPSNITDMYLSTWGNNALAYFTATSTAGGNELWYVYDNGGTPAVAQFADIFVGTTGSTPTSVTAIKDTAINTKRYLYFSATGSATAGAELWMVDLDTAPTGSNKSFNGTEDTQLVVNAASGVLAGAVDPDVTANADSLTALLVSGTTNGTLSLNANGSFTYTPNANYNGSDSFTFKMQDQYGKQSATYTATITVAAVNDAPVAQAGTLTTGQGIYQFGQLVTTDIDSASFTYSVVTGPANGTINLNASTGAYTYTPTTPGFYGTDSFTFKTNDGSADSNVATVNITINQIINPPQMLLDVNSGLTASSPSNFTQVGNLVFFTATTAAAGQELWVTDGTTVGTFMVKDIRSGTTGSSITNMVNMGGALYFIANATGSEATLWKSDGTSAGTVQVSTNINTSGNDTAANLVVMGSKLYFSATTTAAGNELWTSDGTAAGTVLLKDLRSGVNSSTPTQLVTDGTILFFTATDGATGTELWKSDGTVAGTGLVKNVYVSGTVGTISNLAVINGKAYFSGRDTNANAQELWTSDGTSAGTVMISNINTGSGNSSNPANFTFFGGKIYFTATTTTNGTELWVTDGTAGGTAIVKDITSGTGSSTPANLVVAGSKLFFSATDGTNGIELWTSDGTSANTTMVTNINAGSASSTPTSLVAFGSKVYFAATNGATNGIELWVSDGTAGGTSMIKDIYSGATSSSPGSLKIVGDRLYFAAADATYDSEVWVFEANLAPVASNSTPTTPEDTPLNATLVGSDIDSTSLTYSIVTGATNGTVVITNAATGAYTYTPNANFNGSDSFTFKINDGYADSNTATVSITVSAVNDAPVAANATPSTAEDTPLNGTLVATDVDSPSLTYSIVTNASNGTVVITNTATGAYTYTPNANFNGTDSFTFRANDGSVNSNTATVNITITPVNDAPVASGATPTTAEDTPLSGTLVASDVDSPSLTYSIVTNAAHGTVVITNSATGAYTYTPNANYNGPDSFTFKVNDGSLDSNTATVNLTITPVNDAPVGTNKSYSATEDTLKVVNTASGLLSGASDVDGDTFTAVLVSNGSKGVVSLNSNGSFTYTPNANQNGIDTFT
jgi:ELWxxDGT repeat protein/VCBS repeat-containing protein